MQQEQVTCKNCGNTFSGKYCNRCGEKIFTNHDKSIFHFFEESFHFITHFEGTFFNTLAAIFTKPGKLSSDFTAGIRKKYFRPLSFFMLLVVLYLIFPLFVGLNMPFKFYLNEKPYARAMTTKRTGVSMDSLGMQMNIAMSARSFKSDEERFAYGFHYADSVMKSIPKLAKLDASYTKTSEKTSKILLLILIPLTAICLYILSFRNRPFLYDNLVMATELNSFYMLFTFLLTPLLLWLIHLVSPGFTSRYITDANLGIFSSIIFGIFSSIAFRRFYNDPWYISVPKAYVIMYAHSKIVHVIYKFVLFAVTFYLSH